MTDDLMCGLDAIFRLEKASFAYEDGPKILDELDFMLLPGQSIGLAGANGSGKTTLFRCITGLSRLQAGHVYFQGQILKKEKDFYPLRQNVGYVLQNSDDQLFFPSVGEDLAFGPLNLGCTEQEARERSAESLAMVGLEGFERRLTHELSGGEKKLVAIAAILAMRPKALLLDEPLNGLDENACQRLEKIIASLDCARVIISHNPAFLKRRCSEICLMKAGKILAMDSDKWPDNF